MGLRSPKHSPPADRLDESLLCAGRSPIGPSIASWNSALAAAVHTEPGDAGPERIIHRITPPGKRRLKNWLSEPVQHIRDMRIEFQLKVTLLNRAGQSPLALVRAQRVVLQPTLAALDSTTDQLPDHVELWRQHNAAATDAYLRHLEALYQPT